MDGKIKGNWRFRKALGLHTGFCLQLKEWVPVSMPSACSCTLSYDGGLFDLARVRSRLDVRPMSRDDTSDFRPRTGRIRDQGRPIGHRSQSFVD